MSTPPYLPLTRRRMAIAATVIQGWLLLLLFSDRTFAAAIVGSLGIGALMILAVLVDDRTTGLSADLATANERITALTAELADAHTDPVTGLPVRRLAERHLTHTVGVQLTVAVADIDDMHEINNGHDHQFGDDYLAGVAERLDRITATGDMLARLGGDEFVLITTRTPMLVAQALTAATRDPITIGSIQVPVRLSTGICRLPGGDAHLGLGRADLAMFTAKRRRSGIEHYDPGRDGVPQPRGVRPALRPRDRRGTRATTSDAA